MGCHCLLWAGVLELSISLPPGQLGFDSSPAGHTLSNSFPLMGGLLKKNGAFQSCSFPSPFARSTRKFFSYLLGEIDWALGEGSHNVTGASYDCILSSFSLSELSILSLQLFIIIAQIFLPQHLISECGPLLWKAMLVICLYPLLSYGFNKRWWYFSLFSFLFVVRKEWRLSSCLHVETETLKINLQFMICYLAVYLYSIK